MSKLNNYVILNEVYPIVEKSISTRQSQIKNMMANFFETRSTDIYDIGPFSRIYFTQGDVDLFFRTLNIQESNVKNSILKTYYGPEKNFNPKAAQDPLTVTVLMGVRYYLLKKDIKNMMMWGMYLCFSGKFYPSIHYSSFPKFQPIEYRHVMEYAINVMMTDKYEIKQSGTLYKAIYNICSRWIESYEERFEELEDEDVVYLIQQIRTRISSFIQNIAEVYYEAYSNKSMYLSYDSDNVDDGEYHLATNDMFIAQSIVTKSVEYITTKSVNYKLCITASNSDVHTEEIKSIIESIQSDKNSILLVQELIQKIVYEYMATSKIKNVNSPEFIKFAISPKSNTKNENYIRIKQICQQLLSSNAPRYLIRKNRIATANNYERCILTYYAFAITESNKSTIGGGRTA